jgi:excisionase family DNA binding protein
MTRKGNRAGHQAGRSGSGFSKVRQIAEKVDHSERQVRRWIADGDLAVHRFGRSVRVSDADLEAFIASRRRVKK